MSRHDSVGRQHSVARQELERLRADLDARQDANVRLNAENTTLARSMERAREDERQRRLQHEQTLRIRCQELELKVATERADHTSTQAALEELQRHVGQLERENAVLRNQSEEGRGAVRRAEELTARVDELVTRCAQLDHELKSAVKADVCRVLEGRVDGLTKLLDEREAKEETLTKRIGQLMDEHIAKDRQVETSREDLAKNEGLLGEMHAAVDDLRLKLKAEIQSGERGKAKHRDEVGQLKARLSASTSEARASSAELAEVREEMRRLRKEANSSEVEAAERHNELRLTQQELHLVREELQRVAKAERAVTEKWREAQLATESREMEHEKERVVADANATELRQLQAANAALEGVVEGLRADLRTCQRHLDEERSESTKEIDRLRLMCADQQMRSRVSTTLSGAPPSASTAGANVAVGVLSPARPMKL